MIEPKKTNLARKVVFPIKRLEVLHSLASNQLLVQPDLMVCRCVRKKFIAESPGEFIDLIM